MKPRILILDDEPNMGKVLQKLLRLEDYSVEAYQSPSAALEYMRRDHVDVLVTDLRMPEMSGEEILSAVKEEELGCEVIVMTAYGTVESAMRCVRQGAYDYVTKPFDSKALVGTVKTAVKKRNMDRDSAPRQLDASEAREIQGLLGESQAIQSVRQLIAKIAPSDSAVLIYGESGTGKELAARAIHNLSHRHGNRFVAINCASIPENLMESELFGHEKGSFTGADQQKVGLIEAAQEGTLFLDEIGELPSSLQAKLLRALQEREITRVGSVETIPVNVRVIAATNRRLEEAVREGTFREDLYYRLNVLKVKMPPLRERSGDIPMLAEHFLHVFRRSAGKKNLEFDSDVLAALQRRSWPGNVRELKNVIERLVVLSDEDHVSHETLDEMAIYDSQPLPMPEASLAGDAPLSSWDDGEIIDFRQARDQFEADYLRQVLKACGGNVSEAAKKAGISRRSFYEKIEKLGVDQSRFK